MSAFTVVHPSLSGLRWVTLQRKGREKHLLGAGQVPLPPDTLRIQPLGPQIHRAPEFLDAVRTLLGQAGSKRHILVLPDAWMKSFVLEVESLPRRARELHDLVGWHLKKSFMIKPEDVRFAWSTLGNGRADQPRRLVVTFAFDRLAAAFEEVYVSQGVRLGLITSSFWAIYHAVPREGTWALLVLEGDLWSLGFFQGEQLDLFRQRRLLPGHPEGISEEVERTFAALGAMPSRLILYQNPEVLPLSPALLSIEIYTSSARSEVKAREQEWPPFWHPEGEIYCGGFHALP
jgi:hypothetical protein